MAVVAPLLAFSGIFGLGASTIDSLPPLGTLPGLGFPLAPWMAMLSINSMGLRYGASKLCQILIPLLGYILIRDLLVQNLVRQPRIQAWGKTLGSLLRQGPWAKLLPPPSQAQPSGDPMALFEKILGLLSWKIGCDLGFFLVVDALGPWERAFTWSGLIPYTIAQYVFYYLVGRRMIIEGARNPFAPPAPTPPLRQRPALANRLLAKYLHEDMNVTREFVPLRQVLLKPVVDYGGLVLSWSLYTVGIFYGQSGEITLAPLVQFGFFPMFTFYLVNTYGYILGFNLGELLYLRLAELEEAVARWSRDQETLAPQEEGSGWWGLFWQLRQGVMARNDRWKTLKYTQLQGFFDFVDRYNLSWRWLFSSGGGVLCVILVAPSWSQSLLTAGTNLDHAWFQQVGQLNPHQVAQVQQAVRSAALPPSEEVILGFPEAWVSLYQDFSQDSHPQLSQGLSQDIPQGSYQELSQDSYPDPSEGLSQDLSQDL